MRWMGHIDTACMREMRNAYEIFVGNAEGKRPLERTRHNLEDNIKWILGK
jgi:hypothetical protein